MLDAVTPKSEVGPQSLRNLIVHGFCFLAHLSRRLEWAIVIAHHLSSVRPSVRRKLFTFSTWWILMKLGRDNCCCFSARYAQGRIQGGPLDRKATTKNRVHSSDLEACEKKCCYFWFHSIKFLTRFWRLFGVIFANFYAISIDFIRLSALFAFILCNFHVYMRCFYKRLICFKNFNEVLCIDLGEGRGCTNACIIWEHI